MNTCKKCGAKFQPLPGKEWASECFDCWKAGKNNSNEQKQSEAPKQEYRVKDTSTMYVSYAKDLFIAMLSAVPEKEKNDVQLEHLMDQAIALVQKAKHHFS